ncbi:MAG: tRNA dihydrouridine synthase DusB [Verrucomicrobia bacterium]|nr:tRNA dihydrouridine synthase DusB [Verrucomicrobiota bacterium]
MKKRVVPFTLGNRTFASNVFYAPLAGCSDFPFRKMNARFKPGLMYPEMVKMDALVRYDPGTFHILDYSTDMHPIGGQICGSKPQIAGQAAKIIEDLGFDVVDLNCGCPVDKVTKDGSGSGLLKVPMLIGDIIANMVAAVKIPVTVKIRAGWCENSLTFKEIVRIAEAAGAAALCIHARTREQAYHGPANWQWIKEAKDEAKTIKIIGNGDLFTPQAAIDMFDTTGCDAVLVSRGTLGQPWICQEIEALDSGKTLKPHTALEYKEALLEHLDYIMGYGSERKAVVDMRRVGCWYIKKSKGTRNFREAISHAQTVAEIRQLILDFPVDDDPL